MTNESDVGEDLHRFALATVKQNIAKHRLKWNEHKIEDATQTLTLAG